MINTAPQTNPDFSLQDTQSILVLKLDRFGDFVLASPFLRGLRASAPTARIDLVVNPEVLPLAEYCPYVDRVVSFKMDGEACVVAGTNTFATHTFLQDLANKNFDLALIPRFDFDYMGAAAFAASAGAHYRVGFTFPGWCRGLEDYTELYTHKLHIPGPTHEIDCNLALLEFIGGSPQGTGTELWIPPEHQFSAQQKLKKAIGDAPFLAVFVGAGQLRRIFPPDRLNKILAEVSVQFPALHFVFPGGPEESDAIQIAMDGLPNSVALDGKASLGEAAVIAGMSIAVVAMDSGGAHLSAAMNVPMVVFSCHPESGDPADVHSPVRFGPRGRRPAVILQPKQPLWPCQEACRGKNAHCIVAIPNETAIAAILAVVKGRVQEALAAAQQTLNIRLETGRAGVGVAPVNSVTPVETGEVAASLLD